MTKLSISLAAMMLSVTLAPAASAYSTEPAPQSFAQISQVGMSLPQAADLDGTCAVKVTPILASILGLSDDWRESDVRPLQTSLACAEE